MHKKTKKYIYICGLILGIGAISGSIIATSIIVSKNNKNHVISDDIVYQDVNNEQELYINNNSLSLLFYIQANSNYYFELLNNIIDNPQNANYLNIFDYLLNNQNDALYNISSGTTWLFDYNIGVDYNTYYFATNIHVLNIGYSVIYNLNSNEQINFFIPYNNNPSSGILNTYLTQPNGNKNSIEYNELNKIPSNSMYGLNKYWLKFNEYYKRIIPLGAIYGQNIPNNSPYIANLIYTNSENNKNISLYIDNQYVVHNSYKYNQNNVLVNDMGLIEFQLNPNDINTSKYNFVNKYIVNSIFNIFCVPTTINENIINRTYIQKVKFLNELIDEGYYENEDEIKKNFLFQSFESNLSKFYTVAGYPGISYSNNSSYVTYNGRTISSNIIKKNIYNVRNQINLWFDNQNYYYQYDWQKNYLFFDINLGHGSSGSMVINESYQLLGIYWGIIQSDEWINGMVTPIYNKNDTNNLVFRWLKYLNNYNINSELLKLFEKLNNYNFFKK